MKDVFIWGTYKRGKMTVKGICIIYEDGSYFVKKLNKEVEI